MVDDSEPRASLVFETGDERVEIRLDLESAPRTLKALVDLLPMQIDPHCAKIAGDQIVFLVPFIQPFEGGVNINEIAPGAFIYYPERQFCELMFGDLQDEEASVTPLGEAGDFVPALRRIGERLQREQGWSSTRGELSVGPGADWREALDRRAAAADTEPCFGPPPADAALSPALREVRAARREMWREQPAEIAALMARRGIMLPVGPLLVAESEARKLHENLWFLRVRVAELDARPAHGTADPAAFVADMVSVLLRGAADRLANFAGLHEAGSVAARAAGHLERAPDDALAMLDELILYAGRLAGWLDLCLPWQKVNEVTEAASAAVQADSN